MPKLRLSYNTNFLTSTLIIWHSHSWGSFRKFITRGKVTSEVVFVLSCKLNTVMKPVSEKLWYWKYETAINAKMFIETLLYQQYNTNSPADNQPRTRPTHSTQPRNLEHLTEYHLAVQVKTYGVPFFSCFFSYHKVTSHNRTEIHIIMLYIETTFQVAANLYVVKGNKPLFQGHFFFMCC
jgi:hypothetical protein